MNSAAVYYWYTNDENNRSIVKYGDRWGDYLEFNISQSTEEELAQYWHLVTCHESDYENKIFGHAGSSRKLLLTIGSHNYDICCHQYDRDHGPDIIACNDSLRTIEGKRYLNLRPKEINKQLYGHLSTLQAVVKSRTWMRSEIDDSTCVCDHLCIYGLGGMSKIQSICNLNEFQKIIRGQENQLHVELSNKIKKASIKHPITVSVFELFKNHGDNNNILFEARCEYNESGAPRQLAISVEDVRLTIEYIRSEEKERKVKIDDSCPNSWLYNLKSELAAKSKRYPFQLGFLNRKNSYICILDLKNRDRELLLLCLEKKRLRIESEFLTYLFPFGLPKMNAPNDEWQMTYRLYHYLTFIEHSNEIQQIHTSLPRFFGKPHLRGSISIDRKDAVDLSVILLRILAEKELMLNSLQCP